VARTTNIVLSFDDIMDEFFMKDVINISYNSDGQNQMGSVSVYVGRRYI
jgi:hypothetical protein